MSDSANAQKRPRFGESLTARYFWGAMRRTELTVRQREEERERERGGPPVLYIGAWDVAEISRVVPKSQPPSQHRGRETESERKNTQRGGTNQTKGLGSLGDASQRKRYRRWESDSSTALLPKIHLFKRVCGIFVFVFSFVLLRIELNDWKEMGLWVIGR